MKIKYLEFFHGFRDTLPILLGVIPFGMIYGASAISAHMTIATAQAMSSIVFAGSAQFVTVQLIAASVPAWMILLTAWVINLRHALYSLSVAPYLQRLKLWWKMVLSYLMTDEVYAVVITHYQKSGEITYKHWYFLGSGLALWSTWQASTAAGILLGAYIPASWSLDFALPLTFIALVVPLLKELVNGIVAATAAIVAVLAAQLPFNSGLIVATCLGILVGTIIEAQNRKRYASSENSSNSTSTNNSSTEQPESNFLTNTPEKAREER